jgi:hypothetical protein
MKLKRVLDREKRMISLGLGLVVEDKPSLLNFHEHFINFVTPGWIHHKPKN